MAQNNPVNNQTPTTRDHRNFIVDGRYTNIAMSFDEENGEIVVSGLGENEGYIVNIAATFAPQTTLVSDYVNANDNHVDVSTLAAGIYNANLIEPILGRTVLSYRFTVAGGFPGMQWDSGLSGLTKNLEK